MSKGDHDPMSTRETTALFHKTKYQTVLIDLQTQKVERDKQTSSMAELTPNCQ